MAYTNDFLEIMFMKVEIKMYLWPMNKKGFLPHSEYFLVIPDV